MKRSNNKPSELLQLQKKTGQSYWDLIDRPLYAANTASDFDSMLAAYNCGKSMRKYDGGNDYTVGQDTIDQIQVFEGFEGVPYKDKLAKGLLTVGYGFTDPSIVSRYSASRPMTKKEGQAILQQEVNKRAKTLSTLVPHWNELNNNQRDALVSYYFNFPFHNNPKGPKSHYSPKMFKALEERNWEEATRQMDAGWNQAKGIQNRRKWEQAKFLTPVPTIADNGVVASLPDINPYEQITLPKDNTRVVIPPSEFTKSIPPGYLQKKAAANGVIDRMIINPIEQEIERIKNPANIWSGNLLGYNSGKPYPFNFWNRNPYTLKPVIR